MRITEILETENTIYHYGNDHRDHGDSKPKEIYGVCNYPVRAKRAQGVE